MPQVKIGPHHFAGEIKVYRDYRQAYWREQLQNAVDSGASQISVEIGEMQTDGSGRQYQQTTIADNGCGMTVEQLNSIYFVLGETGKKDAKSTGGFGKARILCAFAQRKYELWTGNLHVTGEGADYEIVEVDSKHKGVKIQVDVFTDRDLKPILFEYLKRSYIKATVTVNGERFTDWTFRRHQARELSFATVYTNKQKTSELLVWVNGTLMFVRSTTVGQQVIVDIHPDKSRDVLQANRDGLVMQHQDELDAFINELNMNKRSALTKKRSKSTVFSGTGTFKSKRKPKKVENPYRAGTPSAIQFAIVQSLEAARNGTQTATADGVEATRILVNPPRAFDTGLLRETENVNAGLNLFDVVIEDETSNQKIRDKITGYDPRNWDLDANPVRGNVRGEYRRGIGYLKLLLVWRTACEIAIEQMFDHVKGVEDEISWGVGWIFSDSAEAQHQMRNDVHFLLLNPCKEDGTLNWSLSDSASISKLIMTAAHEVSHCHISSHDEDYANTLTDLSGPLFDIKTEITRRLKDAKSEEAISLLFGSSQP